MGDKKNHGDQNEIRRMAKKKQKTNSRKGKSGSNGGEGFSLQAAKSEQRRRQYAIQQSEIEAQKAREAKQAAEKAAFNACVEKNILALRAIAKRPAIKDILPSELPHQDATLNMAKVHEWVAMRYHNYKAPKTETKKPQAQPVAA
jgi:hypothetical protein